MIRSFRTVSLAAMLGLSLLFLSGISYAAEHYVVANNDQYPNNTVSVFKVSNASLVNLTTIATGGMGVQGGLFTSVTQSIAQDGKNTCLFVGNGYSNSISAVQVIDAAPYLQVVHVYTSPDGSGQADGIGITVSNGYLYAINSGDGLFGQFPPNIDVWQIMPGCTLTFSSSLPNTVGLNGGMIESTAATPNGKYLVAAYGDSVGTYAIGGGKISLISQETTAGQQVGSGGLPSSVAVSANGQWAIFGDSSRGTNTTQLDVAAIGSNGQLAPTTSYGGTGSLGDGLDTEGIALSPDNRYLYAVDLGNGAESTVSFDAATGVITYPNSCFTHLNGYLTEWSFAAQPAVVTNSGSGGGIYISECCKAFKQTSYIALLGVNPKTGCVTEAPQSPFLDSNPINQTVINLVSITSYTR